MLPFVALRCAFLLLLTCVSCIDRGPPPVAPTQEVRVSNVGTPALVGTSAAPVRAAGDRVQVEWQGRWYPAVLVEQRGSDRWFIHYEGYEDSWDEEVGPDRIRALSEHDEPPEEPPNEQED
jgi:hypothetical protein